MAIFPEYNRDNLKKISSHSRSVAAILRHFGFKQSSSSYIRIEKDMYQWNIPQASLKFLKRPYSASEFQEVIDRAKSIKEVLAHLNLHLTYHSMVLLDIHKSQISISHFAGREHVSSGSQKIKKSLDAVLDNVVSMKSHQLKLRLFADGIKEPKCESCKKTDHNESAIPLELNHKNGNKKDNRLSNLEILDPNCHSQTSTFAANNRAKHIDPDELKTAVSKSTSMAETIKNLGRGKSHSLYRRINKMIAESSLPTDHWSDISKFQRTIQENRPSRIRPEDILILNGREKSSDQIKKLLFKWGLKNPQCEVCAIANWNDKPLTFVLDHINGINTDHRIENLRIICYICDARSDTYKGRNAKRLNDLRNRVSASTISV